MIYEGNVGEFKKFCDFKRNIVKSFKAWAL
jgi:hypothetical protein